MTERGKLVNAQRVTYFKIYFLLQSTKKDWEKPGDVKECLPDHFVSSHPGGEDSDSDEDEDEDEDEETNENKEGENNEKEPVIEDKDKMKDIPCEDEENQPENGSA